MKKNIKSLILILFVVILLVAGGTLAFYTWTGINENGLVSLNTSKSLEHYLIYDEGESQFAGDFQVSDTYYEGLHTTLSISKTEEAANVQLIGAIKLTVNEIGFNMAQMEGIRWAVTSGDETSRTVVSEGNFLGTEDGDDMTLYSPPILITRDVKEFTVWVWADRNEVNESMVTEKLDVSVWMQVDQIISGGCSVTQLSSRYNMIYATAMCPDTNITNYAISTSSTVVPTSWINTNVDSNIYSLEASQDTGTYFVWFKDENGTTFVSDSVTTHAAQSTYTITYRDCGNYPFSGTNALPTSYSYGVATALNTPTKAGYTFEGYYETNACTGTPVTSIKSGDEGDKTFYAKWSVTTYTVSFNPNTGTGGPTEPVLVMNGAEMPILNAEKPVKEGYTLLGWFDSSTDFSDSRKYYNLNGTSAKKYDKTSNTTLYAGWVGTILSISATSSTSINITTANTFGLVGNYKYSYASTPEGCATANYIESSSTSHTFNGLGAGEYYGCVKLRDDYIQATKTSVSFRTVTFNVNGGNGGQSASVTAIYGSAMPTISTTKPTRTGYTFMGWYDNADYTQGTQYYTANGSSAKTFDKKADTVLYAGWQVNQYDLTLTKGTGIDKIYYKIGSGSWQNTSSSTTVKVNYGSTYSLYATPASGYTYTDYTSSSPLTGTMGTSGASYSPVGSKDLTLTVGTGISTIYYKIGSGSWLSTTNSTTIQVKYGTSYSLYAIAADGYTYTDYTSSNPLTGTIGTDAVTYAPVGSRTLTLTVGTGISTIYYKVNGASSYTSTTSSTTVQVKYGSTYYVYATAASGYTYTDYTSSNPLTGTMGTTDITYAPVGSKGLTLTIGTGISTIYYKVNGASSYSSTTTTTTLQVKTGTTYYVYATAASGYTYTDYTSSNPLTGTMGTDAVTYAPVGSKTLTLTVGTGISTIYYKVNGASSYSSTTSSTTVQVKYDTTYSVYATPATGYTYTDYSSSNPLTGTMGTNAVTYAPVGTINTVTVKYYVNGGTVNENGYTADSNGLVLKSDGTAFAHTLNYGASWSSTGLANYNNPDALNIKKIGYSAISGAEWKCKSGNCIYTTYDHAKSNLTAADICDASVSSCEISLEVNWNTSLNTVTIYYYANGGTLATSTNSSSYTINSSTGLISMNSSALTKVINYGASADLADMNSPTWLNLKKTGHTAVSGAQWKCKSGSTCGETTYNQSTSYSADKFCDASVSNCSINIEVNWKLNTVTVRYNTNGGTLNTYYADSNGNIYTDSNKTQYLEQTFDYGTTWRSDGFNNYNSSTYLNVTRPTCKSNPASGSEWKCMSGNCTHTTYSQTKSDYTAADMCDASNGNCTITVGVNWGTMTSSLTLTKGTGIGSIKYKVNGASSWTTTSSNKTVSATCGTTAYAYGVAATGYTYTTRTESAPWSATVDEDGVTFNPSATINKLTINWDTNGGTIRASTSTSDGATTYAWTTDSDGLIHRGGTLLTSSVNYGESIDLNNMNNENYIYIARNGYFAVSNAEWKCLSGCCTANATYDHAVSGNTAASSICDISSGSKTAVLGVNWNAIDASVTKASETSITVSFDSSRTTTGVWYFGYAKGTGSCGNYTAATTNTSHTFTGLTGGDYYGCVKHGVSSSSTTAKKSSASVTLNPTPVGNYTCSASANNTSKFLVYTGKCSVAADGTGWKVMLGTSGTLYINQAVAVDIFGVGGGGGGAGRYSYGGGGGGGGGKTATASNKSLSVTSYTITIGSGGSAGAQEGAGGAGSASKFGSLLTANGGSGAPTPTKNGGNGGNGGSGGGTGGYNGANTTGSSNVNKGGAGGGYGANGKQNSRPSGTVGTGQGTTTCEFGAGTTSSCNSGVNVYGSGGGGGAGYTTSSGYTFENGAYGANSKINIGGDYYPGRGGRGGQGNSGSTGEGGARGIIIFRNKR